MLRWKTTHTRPQKGREPLRLWGVVKEQNFKLRIKVGFICYYSQYREKSEDKGTGWEWLSRCLSLGVIYLAEVEVGENAREVSRAR